MQTETLKKKEIKQVPKLRFREFEIPYKGSKFGEVVESNIYGPRFNANDYCEKGNVKTIRGTDLRSDGEIKYSQVPIAQLDKKMIETHRLLDGDLIMITTADCGSTAVFREQEIDYLSSAYGVRIRLNRNGYPYYFKYFFQTKLAKKEINGLIRKATVANLPGSDILKIRCQLPCIKEQQKIASFLSAVDKKIQLLTRKKELLESYKKGVMQQLFSQEIRFKNENEKYFPEWMEKKLSEVCEIIGGGTPDTNSEQYWNGGVNWFTPTEIKQKYVFKSNRTISETGLKNSSGKLLPVNSILFTTRASIGHLAIAKEECATNQGFQSFLPNNNYSTDFLYYSLYFNKKVFIRRSSGSTFSEISKTEIQKIKFEIPSIDEQQKIAEFLSAIDIKIEVVSQQITQTQKFKKGLLQQMFV